MEEGLQQLEEEGWQQLKLVEDGFQQLVVQGFQLGQFDLVPPPSPPQFLGTLKQKLHVMFENYWPKFNAVSTGI